VIISAVPADFPAAKGRWIMIVAGLNHIGHTVSAVSTVLNIPERGRTAAPALLTLAGFTPVQVEILITGFVAALAGLQLILRRAQGLVSVRVPAQRH
jgi:hypothetical protein